MHSGILGIQPARALLSLGAITWLAGMLRPNGSLPDAVTVSFTILNLAPLGIAIAAAGIALASLGTLRWLAVAAMGAGLAGWVFGGTDHAITNLHLGIAAGLVTLALATQGGRRVLAVAGAVAALGLAVANWPGSGLWPLDGTLVTLAGMLMAAPLLALAFDDAAGVPLADRLPAMGRPVPQAA